MTDAAQAGGPDRAEAPRDAEVVRAVEPTGIAPPAATYAHAVLVSHPTRWLHTSGVVPVNPSGSVPTGVAAQAQLVWRVIGVLLEEVGMAASDVVSVTTYVVAGAMGELAAVMGARDAFLGGRRVASTLVTVPALAQPAWLLEVAVVAAQ